MKTRGRLILFFIICMSIMMVGCGEISPNASSDDYKGKRKETAIKKLEDAGFTNITEKTVSVSIADPDYKNTEVKEVVIDGSEIFGSDSKFAPDVPVIVTSYSKPKDKREKKAGFNDSTNEIMTVGNYHIPLPAYFTVAESTDTGFTAAAENTEEKRAAMNVSLVSDDAGGANFEQFYNEKEQWINDKYGDELENFKLLGTEIFETSIYKGIMFDFIFSKKDVWIEGNLLAFPANEDWILVELWQTDNSEFNYKNDFEKICSFITVIDNIISCGGYDFTIPDGTISVVDDSSLIKEMKAEGYTSLDEIIGEEGFILVPEDYKKSDQVENYSYFVIGCVESDNILEGYFSYDQVMELKPLIESEGLDYGDKGEFVFVGDMPGAYIFDETENGYVTVFRGITPDDKGIIIISKYSDSIGKNVVDSLLESATIQE